MSSVQKYESVCLCVPHSDAGCEDAFLSTSVEDVHFPPLSLSLMLSLTYCITGISREFFLTVMAER